MMMNQDSTVTSNQSKHTDNFVDLIRDEGSVGNSDDVQIIAVIENAAVNRSSAVQFIQERRLPNLIQRQIMNTANTVRRSTRNTRSTHSNTRTGIRRARRRTTRNRQRRSTTGLFRLINSMTRHIYDGEGNGIRAGRRNHFAREEEEGDYFPEDYFEDEQDNEDDAYGDDYEELLSLGDRLGDVKPKGLSKSCLDALPQRSFNLNPRLETPTCIICLIMFEQGDGLIHLGCDHFFHKQCARRWLAKNATCPVCRTNVTTTINLIGE